MERCRQSKVPAKLETKLVGACSSVLAAVVCWKEVSECERVVAAPKMVMKADG